MKFIFKRPFGVEAIIVLFIPLVVIFVSDLFIRSDTMFCLLLIAALPALSSLYFGSKNLTSLLLISRIRKVCLNMRVINLRKVVKNQNGNSKDVYKIYRKEFPIAIKKAADLFGNTKKYSMDTWLLRAPNREILKNYGFIVTPCKISKKRHIKGVIRAVRIAYTGQERERIIKEIRNAEFYHFEWTSENAYSYYKYATSNKIKK